jgi:hypothetical protein
MPVNMLLKSILAAALWAGGLSAPDSVTRIEIREDVRRANVERFGINLGARTYYDSGQLTQNLVQRNPGFEGLMYQSVLKCASVSSGVCVLEDAYSTWPDGFWDGAAYEAISATAPTAAGQIQHFAVNGGATPSQLSFAGTAPNLRAGDYVILRKSAPENPAAGWWPQLSGAVQLSAERNDLAPDTEGRQALRISALSSGAEADLLSFFDTTQGYSSVRLAGGFRVAFRAKGVGGARTLGVSVSRLFDLGPSATYLQSTLTLDPSWQNYALDFSANESIGATGKAFLEFTVTGSEVLLDDVRVFPAGGDPSNTTAFRDSVVNALKQYKPGGLRYWADQLGDSLDNQIAPVFARQRAGYSIWSATREDIDYGLHEFLELCESTGADPWFAVPVVYSPKEAANLIEYLAGGSSTAYGSKRAARGHAAPWTGSFSKIHLEFGNESWNQIFRGGSIEDSAAYGSRAQVIFAAMRSAAAFDPGKFDLILGSQAAWAGRTQAIQPNCNNNDSVAIAPYMMQQVDSFGSYEQLFGPLFAEAEMNSSTAGSAFQHRAALDGFDRSIGLNVYEMNLHTAAGSISQAALDQLIPSLGSGLAVASSMLQMLRDLNVRSQMMFALPQTSFGRSDGKTVRLWGTVFDLGVTDRRRPQFQALALVNEAMNGDLMTTVHTGYNPVWNQPQMNGVQLDGAHYLQSFAFRQGGQWSLILLNLQRNSALPVTFRGMAPTGNVTMKRLTSGDITDNNESAVKIQVTTQQLVRFDPYVPFTLPPYSLTVLQWGIPDRQPVVGRHGQL